MEFQVVSAMESVFRSDAVLPPPIKRLRLLQGETGGVQLVFRAGETRAVQIDAAGGLRVRLFTVEEVPVGLPVFENAVNCTLLRGGRPGDYPDLLRPLAGELTLAANETRAVYAQLCTADVSPGRYDVSFTLTAGEARLTQTVSVDVSATALPAQTLIHTDWFHADCLSVYYGVEPWSEAHWRIVENFMENAAAHGVNCLLTPLFTPPLDTAVGHERPTVQLVDVTKKGYAYTFGFDRLFRWIMLAKKHGVQYFEFSHFFTQWGAKHAPKVIAHTKTGDRRIFGWETQATSRGYVGFLRQLGQALLDFTQSLGITDRCFVHCSDEPGRGDLAQYKKVAAVVREAFPRYRQLDALSDYSFYENGLVETPVPGEGEIDRFAGRVPHLWTYYCCGQFNDELPNRFIAMPAARNRILGALLWKYDCEGFLHWGYNFYFTQYSLRPVDPFRETDAGGAFPSGDSFVVYPGEDGKPLTTLRQQMFFAGLQDLRALRAAEAKTDRQTVTALLRDTMGEIDFSHYPMDPAAFERMRGAVSALLEKDG